jgi:CheY-like chemotaxis protein
VLYSHKSAELLSISSSVVLRSVPRGIAVHLKAELPVYIVTRPIKNILLVEDDVRDVELTLAALTGHHLANPVFVVYDGEQALDYLHHRGTFSARAPGNPVVVLLDNKMPKVSGLEVLKAMKADDVLKTIPVVALTSSRESPDMTEFYKHGVNAYVVKPVDFTEFMAAVKQIGVFWAAVNESPEN